ncbi:MAG: glycosyltransferase family 2 protein [Verrucomicrobiae bacterium]|nr:glycosyltransferase family 2 protein [Verrucomicrobiae bacterium]
MISVVIPTYNRASLVSDAIESALAQTHPLVEIVVVDDGSTDGTLAVLSRYPNVKILHQRNQGQGAARQAGLALATGSFLATLDSDDIWLPDFLSDSLEALRKSGAGFAFSNWSTISPNGVEVSEGNLGALGYLAAESAEESGSWRILASRATRSIFTRHCPAPSSSFLVRRDLVTNGWMTGFRISDDWAFLLEIILDHGPSCAYQLEPLWTKRIDGTNICDRHADPVRLAEKEIHDLSLLLQQFGSKLDHSELTYLRRRLNSSRHDLAHFQALAPGSRRRAVKSALAACQESMTVQNAALLAKNLMRSVFGLRR